MPLLLISRAGVSNNLEPQLDQSGRESALKITWILSKYIILVSALDPQNPLDDQSANLNLVIDKQTNDDTSDEWSDPLCNWQFGEYNNNS